MFQVNNDCATKYRNTLQTQSWFQRATFNVLLSKVNKYEAKKHKTGPAFLKYTKASKRIEKIRFHPISTKKCVFVFQFLEILRRFYADVKVLLASFSLILCNHLATSKFSMHDENWTVLMRFLKERSVS